MKPKTKRTLLLESILVLFLQILPRPALSQANPLFNLFTPVRTFGHIYQSNLREQTFQWDPTQPTNIGLNQMLAHGDEYMDPSARILSDGLAGIVVESGPPGQSTLSFIKCLNEDCNAWITQQPSPLTALRYTALAIGSDGFPVIATTLKHGQLRDLLVIKCGDLFCSPGLAQTSTVATNFPVLGIDHISMATSCDGRPLVVFDGGGVLRYIECLNGSCSQSQSQILDNESGWKEGIWPYIGVSPTCQPYVLHTRKSADDTTAQWRLVNSPNTRFAAVRVDTLDVSESNSYRGTDCIQYADHSLSCATTIDEYYAQKYVAVLTCRDSSCQGRTVTRLGSIFQSGSRVQITANPVNQDRPFFVRKAWNFDPDIAPSGEYNEFFQCLDRKCTDYHSFHELTLPGILSSDSGPALAK